MRINFSELIGKYKDDYMNWMGQLEVVHFSSGLAPECQLSRGMILYFEKGLGFQGIVEVFKREGPELVELRGECLEMPAHTLETLAFAALFHHRHVLKKPPVQVVTDPRLHEIVDILGVELVCFLSAIDVEVVGDNRFSVSFAPEFWCEERQ